MVALSGEAAQPAGHTDARGLQPFVFALFFIFGGITSLNDVIIPKLKELFELSWTEAMLVQFCFFFAYAAIGIPGAMLIKKIGYMRGAVAGLLTMMVGCLLFIPASQNAVYGLFLFALFVLAEYINMVTVSALATTLFLGGWRAPWPISIWESANTGWWPLLWWLIKVQLFIFVFIWLRGTLPRMRYDQFMKFGWKVLIPVTLGMLAMAFVYLARRNISEHYDLSNDFFALFLDP